MIRFSLHVFLAILLSVIESSFFSSLDGALRLTPFVLIVSVYVLQHHAVYEAPLWMIMHGMVLDAMHATEIPFLTIAYMVAALVAYVSAKKVFSNRSLYGVLACAVSTFFVWSGMSFLFRLSSVFLTKTPFSMSVFFHDAFDQFLMMILLLTILFSFGKQIRRALIAVGFSSAVRQSY